MAAINPLHGEFSPATTTHRRMTDFEGSLKKYFDKFKDAGFDTAILAMDSGWTVAKGTPQQTAALVHFEFSYPTVYRPKIIFDLNVPFETQLASSTGLTRHDAFIAPTIAPLIRGFDKDGFEKMNVEDKKKALPEYMYAHQIGEPNPIIINERATPAPATM